MISRTVVEAVTGPCGCDFGSFAAVLSYLIINVSRRRLRAEVLHPRRNPCRFCKQPVCIDGAAQDAAQTHTA
jgi:hypothetical protein